MERSLHLLVGHRDLEMAAKLRKEKETRCQRAAEKVSDALVTLSNEPSLALFRIQEHVRKCTPVLIEERNKVGGLYCQLQGRCFELDYNIRAVESIARSVPTLSRVTELLKSSIFLKLQLDYWRLKCTVCEIGVDLAATVDACEVNSDSDASESSNQKEDKSSKQFSTGAPLAVAETGDINREVTSPSSLDSAPTSPLTSANHFTSTVSAAAVEAKNRAVGLTRRAFFSHHTANAVNQAISLEGDDPTGDQVVDSSLPEAASQLDEGISSMTERSSSSSTPGVL